MVCLLFPAVQGEQVSPPHLMRVLAMGEVDTSYCPIWGYCQAEPSLDATLVVARDMHATTYGEAGLKRIIRLYLPRNLEGMLEYDFILINQPVVRYFPPNSLQDIYLAIAEGGRGALCFMESQYADIYGPWLETQLYDCFPYDHSKNLKLGAPGDKPFDLEIVRDPNLPPLMTPYIPLGIENIKPFGEARPTFERPGATVWAYCHTNAFLGAGVTRFPLFISWRYGPGNALVWVTADQFDTSMWRTNDGKERYALDIFTGFIWLSSGWDLPDDPIRVHILRDSFIRLRSRITLVGNIIEFADSFGANTQRVEKRLAGLQLMGSEAGELYLEHEFDLVESKMREAFDLALEIEAESVELKERALTWAYLVEWLTVTSTSALSGVVIWSLMVKRRMFRPVSATRSVGS